jgi:hypothetical protein
MSHNRNNNEVAGIDLPQECCTAHTGCSFDGSLRNVVSESIYTQKVYDAALFNLQGLRTIQNQAFYPDLGEGARIIRVLAIRCRKFFNPENINDTRNLAVEPQTEISGADFVQQGGCDVRVIGPDGTASERIVYTDTTTCDNREQGTPVFGTQTISISGNVIVEIDVLADLGCENERVTLTANVQVAPRSAPLILTNFFELCLPSVYDGAFLPRFTEFCNLACQPRLATNNINRDFRVNPETGEVRANLLISLCVTCEKKIVVPVQLCVLSTGFPVLAAETAPICSTFPTLFPRQINDDNDDPCVRNSEDAGANTNLPI